MTKRLNIKIFWISTLTLSLLLFVFCILQIGYYTQDVYLIRNYEERLAMLSKNNKFLNINLSKMDSLANIDSYLANKNFVKANQIKYIQILENSVVAKDY